jgi:hypothetical protein
MKEFTWSKTEKTVAKRAFEAAHRKEYAALARKIKEMAANVKEPEDIWSIHDFLTEKRKEIARKYDYRYSQLILVFSLLIREGWMEEADLHGLREDKMEKIKSLASRLAPGSNED